MSSVVVSTSDLQVGRRAAKRPDDVEASVGRRAFGGRSAKAATRRGLQLGGHLHRIHALRVERPSMTSGRDADDAALEIVVERQPVPALGDQPREAPADVAEANQREISPHASGAHRRMRR